MAKLLRIRSLPSIISPSADPQRHPHMPRTARADSSISPIVARTDAGLPRPARAATPAPHRRPSTPCSRPCPTHVSQPRSAAPSTGRSAPPQASGHHGSRGRRCGKAPGRASARERRPPVREGARPQRRTCHGTLRSPSGLRTSREPRPPVREGHASTPHAQRVTPKEAGALRLRRGHHRDDERPLLAGKLPPSPLPSSPRPAGPHAARCPRSHTPRDSRRPRFNPRDATSPARDARRRKGRGGISRRDTDTDVSLASSPSQTPT
jgi:hypothetical protein